jgi:hypothetical protein
MAPLMGEGEGGGKGEGEGEDGGNLVGNVDIFDVAKS